ncbi:MAG: hypothetical protein IT359_04560 [Gemmatimonadaceae bacterium]|nr:hypothetical protein [Gemmatimonadaceae bacterium]
MLAYLEALCNALKGRDALAIIALLRHPLASALPAQVVDEAERIAAAGSGTDFIAPIHAFRLYHQTAHLLGVCTDPATRRRPAGHTRSTVAANAAMDDAESAPQIELELPLRIAVA